MKGIILKDLYENFRIAKNGLAYVGAILFVFLLADYMQIGDPFIQRRLFVYIVAFIFPILSTSSLEASLEQDEAMNFDKLQITFPLTKAEIVLSKYILGLLFFIPSSIASLAAAFLLTHTYSVISLSAGLSIWGIGLIITFVFWAFSYFSYFFFGRKMGIIVFVTLAASAGGIYGAISTLVGIKAFLECDKTMILAIGIPVGILLVMLSYFLSLVCYKRRHS